MSDLRAKVQDLRNSLRQSVDDHRLVQGEREHARGWFNAYETVVFKLDALLSDHAPVHLDTAEKRAMRSAVAWYVEFLERERDNRG